MRFVVILCAHGLVAGEILEVVKDITGVSEDIYAVNAERDRQVDEIRREILKYAEFAMKEENSGVLIITDMFGGTPSNIAFPLKTERLDIVTGLNIPAVITAVNKRKKTESLTELAAAVAETIRKSAVVSSNINF